MGGYGDDAGFAAYAAAAGYTVPAGTISAARQRGSAYIDGTYGMRFPGQPTGGIGQEREWPRTGATAFGAALASDLIPQRVIDASYE
ncbi:DnaT-like ssDNA-binding protein, partial [Mesorhizobium sp. B1-1-5]|uniref:DnaT-like ssDNA-binding protein n=1 Tax=Mesorhizobium sp. B1-1-5 TaxID=2589979 RepID=UPI00116FCB42